MLVRHHVGDDAELVLDMVEDQEGGIEAEVQIRQVEIILAGGGNLLDQADRVVADQSHGAAGEGGQIRIVHAAIAIEEFPQLLQGIRLVDAFFLSANLDVPPLGGEVYRDDGPGRRSGRAFRPPRRFPAGRPGNRDPREARPEGTGAFSGFSGSVRTLELQQGRDRGFRMGRNSLWRGMTFPREARSLISSSVFIAVSPRRWRRWLPSI